MRIRFDKRALVLGGALAMAPIALVSAATTGTTASGVYTAAQAEQGHTIYTERCAMCHGQDLAGTYEIAPLTGRFLGNWEHASVGTLFDYVGRAMPQMAPGTLRPDEDAAVIAYALQQNGMPAGAKPLSTDAKTLDSIMIDPPGKAAHRPGR